MKLIAHLFRAIAEFFAGVRHSFQPGDRISVSDPRLLVQGDLTIEEQKVEGMNELTNTSFCRIFWKCGCGRYREPQHLLNGACPKCTAISVGWKSLLLGGAAYGIWTYLLPVLLPGLFLLFAFQREQNKPTH